MKAREMVAEYRLEHWMQVMRERTESGLSVKAYCENTGLRQHTYYYWQRKLREVACEQLSTQGFAEVKLEVPSAHMTLSEPDDMGQLHVEVHGISITADGAYPSEKLATLLLELSRLC